MLGVGQTGSAKDRSVYRQSWSSDEPTSSNASISSRERKGLWGKLRKQASRMHVSHAGQPDAVPQMPHRGSVSSAASAPLAQRPVTVADVRRTSAVVAPSVVTAGAHESLHGEAGLERLKMIAAMGSDAPVSRAASLAMQPRRAAPPPPSRPSQQAAMRGSVDMRGSVNMRGSFDTRGSVDMFRRGAAHSYSMDVARPDHRNPADISAESIRRTLGAYTGKSDSAKPRLRRLLPTRRPPSRDLSLECIAEDDEVHVHEPHVREPAHDVKRFSENSGSTACSSDTLDERPARGRQRMSVQARPKAVFYEDGVGLDAQRGLRPASAQLRTSALSRQSSTATRARLSKCASDETLDVKARLAEPPRADEAEQLRRAVRRLEARNELLAELLAADAPNAAPESLRLRLRTVELENTWLRGELARLRAK
ncbi:hypothetical protein H4R23_002198 [Coemansia sp. Cherry 401B]|nr:hypothetical protein H4R23_002198 [Coemansia sp. Cherry 401B]